MVERAAVNRDVVGSSPTSGANFIEENERFGISDTLPTHETPKSAEADVMKWPKKVKHRNKVLAKIYRPCEGRVEEAAINEQLLKQCSAGKAIGLTNGP